MGDNDHSPERSASILNDLYSHSLVAEKSNVWGVLGGMGPIASAEFISTVYNTCKAASEQEMPIVHLYSDPTVPDRTSSLLIQNDELLLKRLEDGISGLLLSGASRVVVCCMTMHCMIDRLPANYQLRIVSLLDILFEAILTAQRPHLMMCSSGAKLKRLYESHVCWEQARKFIIIPDDSDQKSIHDLIYAIKRDRQRALCDDFIYYLGQKYDTKGFIAGCTELHLVSRLFKAKDARQIWKPSWIDPLENIANIIASSGRYTTEVL